LTPWYAAGQDKHYPPTNYQSYNLRDEVEIDGKKFYNQHVNNKGDNHLFARKVAAESTVYVPRICS
jgi:beta-glucosidase